MSDPAAEGTAPLPRITITPDPAVDERDAVVAALAVAQAASAARVAGSAGAAPDRWAIAGRRAAMGGITAGAPSGWGRDRP